MALSPERRQEIEEEEDLRDTIRSGKLGERMQGIGCALIVLPILLLGVLLDDFRPDGPNGGLLELASIAMVAGAILLVVGWLKKR